MSRLAAQRAVVTASGGKMGGTIATHLAREGCSVALNDLDADLTAPYAQRIRDLGGEVIEVIGDVTEREHAAALVQGAIDTWGGVDILVNCAGGSAGPYHHDILTITDDEWDRTLALNLRPTFLCSQLVVPGMMERRHGKIVNIASATWAGGVAPYSISKSAVVAFTRGLANEMGPYNINVNAIAPGATKTRFQPPPELADLVPLHRVNDPEDIADSVVFLASEESRNISGQLITVAGGRNPSL
jgi:NAD(P)-dependent dehydrogenase (short-subunit alcohol dehydrogenase family)